MGLNGPKEWNVLCVCQANACRSPMMEAMLHDAAVKVGLIAQVESAGTMEIARKGLPITDHSLTELRARELDLADHKSRHVDAIGGLRQFDLILCATDIVARDVRELAPDDLRDRIIVVNAESGGIPNPYGYGPEVYRACAEAISVAMTRLAEELHQKPV